MCVDVSVCKQFTLHTQFRDIELYYPVRARERMRHDRPGQPWRWSSYDVVCANRKPVQTVYLWLSERFDAKDLSCCRTTISPSSKAPFSSFSNPLDDCSILFSLSESEREKERKIVCVCQLELGPMACLYAALSIAAQFLSLRKVNSKCLC